MENCLVTKLKGVVDNDTLPTYGCFNALFKADTTGAENLRILPDNNQQVTLTILNPQDGEFLSSVDASVSGTSITLPINNSYYFHAKCNAGTIVRVNAKYNMSALEISPVFNPFFAVNVEDIIYSPNMTHILSGNASTTGTLKRTGNGLVGDVSLLSKLRNLVYISIIDNEDCYGSIDSVIVNNTNLATLRLGYQTKCSINSLDVFNNHNWSTIIIPGLKVNTEGNLSYFLTNNNLKFSNLKTLNVEYCNIKTSNATLSRLRELGITVSIRPNQIVD